jgi:RimJ/RimL family protein N-acetyltransferase
VPELVTPALPAGTLCNRLQPVLAVDELTLRPWRAGDVATLVSAYEDPAIRRWHVRSMTGVEAAGWIAAAAAKWSGESGVQWAVCDPADAVLGRVGIGDLDLADAHAELGYWTVPAARGRGVAPRAVGAVARWMFEEIGFHRVEIEHSTANPASCRVAEKAGFAWEGTRVSSALHTDGWHDMHVHARLADRQPCEGPGHQASEHFVRRTL